MHKNIVRSTAFSLAMATLVSTASIIPSHAATRRYCCIYLPITTSSSWVESSGRSANSQYLSDSTLAQAVTDPVRGGKVVAQDTVYVVPDSFGSATLHCSVGCETDSGSYDSTISSGQTLTQTKGSGGSATWSNYYVEFSNVEIGDEFNASWSMTTPNYAYTYVLDATFKIGNPSDYVISPYDSNGSKITDTIEMTVGDTIQIDYKGLGGKSFTANQVGAYSNNTSVGVIDSAGTITANSPGSFYIYGSYSENSSVTVESVQVNVSPAANQPPVIDSIDTEETDSGFKVTVNATDPDGDTIDYGYSDTAGDSSTVDNWQSSNEFNLSLPGDFYFYVKDPNNSSSTGTRVTVTEQLLNVKPSITNIAVDNSSGEVTVEAEDTDGTIAEYGYSDSDDSNTVTNWQSENTFTVDFGDYYFFAKDDMGKVSESYEASRIDGVESISVSGVKTDYEVGDSFVEQGTVTSTMISGGDSQDNLVESMISGFDTTTPGTKTVTVTHNGCTTTYDITVAGSVDFTITGAKTDYEIGESFVEQGTLNISLTGGGTKTESLLESMISGFDTTTPGTKTITVTHDGMTSTYDIFVHANKPVISDITVSSDDTKVNVETESAGDYEYGYSSSDDSSTVTNWQSSSEFKPMQNGDYYFFVRNEIDKAAVSDSHRFTASDILHINSITVTGVTTNYEVGGQFDDRGSLTVGWTDDSRTTVDLEYSMLSGFDTSSTGNKTVTVTYNGFTDTYNISVSNIADVNISIDIENENNWAKYKIIEISGIPAEAVDNIITPNGKINSHMTSFLVNKNGTYNFTVNSKDGLSSDSDSVTVTKIDNEAPHIVLGYNAAWNRYLIDVVDNGEVDRVMLPDGSTYFADELPIVIDADEATIGTVVAYDKAGNIASKEFSFKLAHLESDSGSSSGSGDTTSDDYLLLGNNGVDSYWTNRPISVDIFAETNTSEIESMGMEDPDGNSMNATNDVVNNIGETAAPFSLRAATNPNIIYTRTATFNITENGTYTYTATNSTGTYTDTFTIDNIDTEAPRVSLSRNIGSILNIDITDDKSGVQLIDVPSTNPVYMEAEGQGVTSALRKQLDISNLEDGEYTITVTDYAGNKSLTTFVISNGDIDLTQGDTSTVDSVLVTLNMNQSMTGVSAGDLLTQLESGSSFTLPDLSEDFLEETVKFVCWNTSPDGTGTSYNFGDVIENIDSDITLYLITADREYGMVTIYGNDSGFENTDTKIEIGKQFTFPNVTVSENKEFLGFSDSFDGEVKYQSGDKITVSGDTEYYVISKIKEYTVKINANNSGYEGFTDTLEHGSIWVIPEIEVSDKKIFKGLSDSDTGTATYQPGDELTITSDKTLYVITTNKPTPKPNNGSSSSGGSSRPTVYDIIISSDVENGKIKLDKDYATIGSTVKFEIIPNTGYEYTNIEIVDSKGKVIDHKLDSDKNTCSFKMPSKDVTIFVEFEKIETPESKYNMSYESCNKGSNCLLSKFTDLKTTEWYHDGVHFCIANNIMNGVSNNKFDPNGKTTRAMMVQILYKISGDGIKDSKLSFKDVDTSSWYAEAVAWAKENKIVSGYTNNTFGPNDPVTREQMVTMLYNYASYKGMAINSGVEKSLSAYKDAEKISKYAVPAMKWAVAENIVSSTGANKIDPRSYSTRAQIATLVMNFLVNLK